MLVIFAVAMIIFNKLVKLRNMVKEGWSGIDVQLKRRYDLIPNLISTVKGFIEHERNIFRDIASLRTQAMQASSPNGKSVSENVLAEKLAQLMITIENYPTLQSDKNFLEVQREMVEVEDHIQYARRYYNGAVRNYNIGIESFPSNLFAFLFGFKKHDFFELKSVSERQSIDVSFYDDDDAMEEEVVS